MVPLLIGVAALLLVLVGLRAFTNLDAHYVVKSVRKGGGIAALAGAAFFAVSGRFPVAVPLGFLGLGLLDLIPGRAIFGSARPTPGQSSKVRSSMIEMELDHDTGAMRGTFVAGPYAGTPLDQLPPHALAATLSSIDEESRALLEVYLDRRDPAWREYVKEDAGARAGKAPGKGPMSEEEACQILGVEPGASAIEIRRAHRNLMLKLHPDQGGSTYLAARVNEAKEVLLRTHH
jgi:DnaJ-domain-containing protein 1